jgi:hypothetical protein
MFRAPGIQPLASGEGVFVPEYLRPGVFVQEESSGVKPIEGVGTSTACFIGAAARGRPFYPTFVTSWSEYERLFGGLQKGADMPLAVYHFFLNGGKRTYIVRLLDPEAPTATAAVPLQGSDAALTVRAAGSGAWAKSMSVEIRLSRAGGNPFAPNQPADSPPPMFDFVVLNEVDGEKFEVEVLPRLGIKEDGERFYASLINRDSRFIKIDVPAEAKDFPESLFKVEKVQDRDLWRLEVPLAGGEDGSPDKLFLDTTIKQALQGLDTLDDLNMLAFPGVFDNVLVGAGIDYAAKRRDLIFIIDSLGDPRNRTPREVQLSDVKAKLRELTPKDSHAALYFPWIEVSDPYSRISGATRFAPPSGAIAGLYARTDNRRGVWKAPAGTEASILGAVGVAVEITDNDQEDLNPIGVNCIRQFPDSGIVCWGSRTIATRQDPEYRYVPVRRFAMFLAKSLYRGTQWAVFEPNDEPLWSAIRFNLNAFMLRQFRSGALQGGKPEEAYFVKCDAENNPQASIDAGEVHITVGFAPLKPAEFVIIHLTQMRKE